MTVGLFEPDSPHSSFWRARLFVIVFGDETPPGRAFDLLLIAAIFTSIVVAIADSVPDIHLRYGSILYALEWTFTIIFTVEYTLRLMIVRHPWRYARSFYGVIDILAVLPTYLAIITPGVQFFIFLRVLRILRIFKSLHLKQYIYESWVLINALRRSA